MSEQGDLLTPWFIGRDAQPVREGRYEVQFCAGWRAVACDWRQGAWWVGGFPFGRPTRVNLRRWPEFRWRGLRRRALRPNVRSEATTPAAANL